MKSFRRRKESIALAFTFALVFVANLLIGGFAQSAARDRQEAAFNSVFAGKCAAEQYGGGKPSTPAGHTCADCLACSSRAHAASVDAIIQQSLPHAFIEFGLFASLLTPPADVAVATEPLGWASSWSSRGSPTGA